MMRTMTRCVAIMAVCVLASVAPAAAQVTYQITTVPTFVVISGDSEVLGSVRLTATNTGPTIASTIEFFFPGTSCDNDFDTGMVLTTNSAGAPSFVVYPAAGYNVAPTPDPVDAVTNTSGGCIVNITVAGGLTPSLGPPPDYLELSGVRGRIELDPLPTLTVSLFAAPSNSSLFTVPNSGTVATPLVGLTSSVTAGAELLCIGQVKSANIILSEGFNTAFVQQVMTAALGSAPPLNARQVYGAVNNTQIRLIVGPIPAGVTLTFPNIVTGNIGVYHAGVSGDELQLLPQGSGVISGPTAGYSDLIYEYACGNQAVCDTTLESFDITVDSSLVATASLGTVTVGAELNPRESVPEPPFTSAPNSSFGPPASPRFSDAEQGPYPLDVISPCSTTLLFPWVVSNVGGFDTGIAIANTSWDYTNDVPVPVAVPYPTPPEHGTCTIYGFPKGEGASIQYTTADVSAGDTYTAVLSTTIFNGFAGYVIARCNFQYGHGQATITNNYGTSMPPTVGFGYIALIIPDPVVNANNFTNLISRPATPDDNLSAWDGIDANTGESLSQ